MKTPKWHWTKQPNADEIRKRISESLQGRKPNAGSFQKGRTNPVKGKKLPWAKKAADARKKSGMYEMMSNGGHPNWKKTGVSMTGLHTWVKRHLGKPMKCQRCGFTSKDPRRIQWANISHKYKRSLTDWARLCGSCHRLYDLGRITL